MMRDTEQRRARVASVGVATALLLLVVGVVPEPVAFGLLLVAIIAGWRFVPRFWAAVVQGAVGGAIAGLLVLGPGLRIAMRIVALMDPLRSPELTLDGTLLIVVMVGGMFGGIVGIVTTVLRAGLDLSRRPTVALTTAVIMAMLTGEPELRSELLELGAGGWVNIPMFALVVVAYAVVATRLVDRLAARSRRRLVTHAAVVRA